MAPCVSASLLSGAELHETLTSGVSHKAVAGTKELQSRSALGLGCLKL